MKYKPVVCSDHGNCERICQHGDPHQRELLDYDPDWGDVGHWCTEWAECRVNDNKVRCTRVREAI